MKIEHKRDRNTELAKCLPCTGDQLDAMWSILMELAPEKVQANPVYQAIKDIKVNKFPKNPNCADRKAVRKHHG